MTDNKENLYFIDPYKNPDKKCKHDKQNFCSECHKEVFKYKLVDQNLTY